MLQFTIYSHHIILCMFLTETLYNSTEGYRAIIFNAHYIELMKNTRALSSISYLARQNRPYRGIVSRTLYLSYINKANKCEFLKMNYLFLPIKSSLTSSRYLLYELHRTHSRLSCCILDKKYQKQFG